MGRLEKESKAATSEPSLASKSERNNDRIVETFQYWLWQICPDPAGWIQIAMMEVRVRILIWIELINPKNGRDCYSRASHFLAIKRKRRQEQRLLSGPSKLQNSCSYFLVLSHRYFRSYRHVIMTPLVSWMAGYRRITSTTRIFSM
jgi:hypothetical protein